MNEQEYKKKLWLLKNSCRVYMQEKAMLETLCTAETIPDPQLIKYLREDVNYVDSILNLAREKCGTPAMVMIWLLMIEEKTQVSVAHEFNISRRQLQYSFAKYMHAVFEEENADSAE